MAPVKSSPRKARKSTRGYGTRSSNQTPSNGTSTNISQMTTLPLPGSSRSRNDSSSDSDHDVASTRRALRFSGPTPATASVRTTRPNRRVLAASSEDSDNGSNGPARKKPQVEENSEEEPSSDDSYTAPKTSPEKKRGKPSSVAKKRTAPTPQIGSGRRGNASQPSTSQMRDQRSTSFDESGDQSLSSKCVSYILIADKKKHSIKKADILKHVFEGYDNKQFVGVFAKAKSILEQTFGLELLEVSNKKNEYLLVNVMDRQLGVDEFAESSTIESYQQGLVFFILTVIFMNGNNIEEDKLWKTLAPLGLDVNSRLQHPVFGDIKKFVIDVMQKKLYIERKLVCKDPESHEIIWGDRAFKEVDKKNCLKFACEMDGTQPQDWIIQCKESLGSNEEENDA